MLLFVKLWDTWLKMTQNYFVVKMTQLSSHDLYYFILPFQLMSRMVMAMNSWVINACLCTLELTTDLHEHDGLP